MVKFTSRIISTCIVNHFVNSMIILYIPRKKPGINKTPQHVSRITMNSRNELESILRGQKVIRIMSIIEFILQVISYPFSQKFTDTQSLFLKTAHHKNCQVMTRNSRYIGTLSSETIPSFIILDTFSQILPRNQPTPLKSVIPKQVLLGLLAQLFFSFFTGVVPLSPLLPYIPTKSLSIPSSFQDDRLN